MKLIVSALAFAVLSNTAVQANPFTGLRDKIVARAAITAQMHQAAEALQRGDVNGAAANMSPTFVEVNKDGVPLYTRAAVIINLRKVVSGCHIQKITQNITKFEMVDSKGAVVNGSTTMIATLYSPRYKRGVIMTIHVVGEDYWSKTHAGWKLQLTRDLATERTVL